MAGLDEALCRSVCHITAPLWMVRVRHCSGVQLFNQFTFSFFSQISQMKNTEKSWSSLIIFNLSKFSQSSLLLKSDSSVWSVPDLVLTDIQDMIQPYSPALITSVSRHLKLLPSQTKSLHVQAAFRPMRKRKNHRFLYFMLAS